ncbi:MAG: hypothetical protein ACRDBQ_18775 [Shewanella sp.]
MADSAELQKAVSEGVAKVLDVLISAGDKPLTESEAADVNKALEGVEGVESVDTTKPANVILATIKPMIVEQVGTLAMRMEAQAVTSIEGLDEKYAKETMMTLWPELSLPVKLIVLMMSIGTVIICGLNAAGLYEVATEDVLDQVIVSILPLFGLFVFCTWPIKTLAYTSLSVGAKVAEARMNKSMNKKTGKSA